MVCIPLQSHNWTQLVMTKTVRTRRLGPDGPAQPQVLFQSSPVESEISNLTVSPLLGLKLNYSKLYLTV